jgi:hypothetical protein
MSYVIVGYTITAVAIISYVAWVLSRTKRIEAAMVIDLRNKDS